MKIVKYYNHGGPEVLVLEEVPVPMPGTGEVVIKVSYFSINYSEIQQRKGIYPIPSSLPATMGQWGVVTGEIVDIGDEVDSLLLGANVLTQVPSGSYAEYVVVPSYLLIPLPAELDSVLATALPTQGQTAYHALKTVGKLSNSETVMIHAASGGVGNIAIQMAEAFGAKKIIATASSHEKLDVALSLGAHIAINYSSPNWSDEVLAQTGGKGVDLVLSSVGGTVLRESTKVLSTFGRLLYFGSSSSENHHWDDLNLVSILSNKTFIGFNIAHLLTNRPELVREGLESMFGLMIAGQLKPKVSQIFSLDEVGQAHALIESRKNIGTVVIKP
ncbi:zinc-binding dehydrogenase [Bacillus sp. 31A1R]|uniref:Zinc-binding dehydrogenase n=1 Tax=Robertmurraya mangrovi TaxID=3098077 RepID=A0ABU5J0I9_9BACI|nr:zinc-binding dehydrogenase [Bacillus sp. 31A1R]MDZ5472901.1 zinc-binding dehydrogenase [Bacillus sp. 31A1R]